jgi:hypothetical protein
MMHDLGLTEKYMADARFEVDGADAAAKILRDHQYPEEKIDIAWQAIALHSTMEIPDRMLPEIALVHLGAFSPMADMPETRWRSSCGAPGHGSWKS